MNRNLLLTTSVIAGLAAITGAAQAQGLAANTLATGSVSTTFDVYGGGSTAAVNLYNRVAQAIATSTNVGLALRGKGLNTAGTNAATATVTQGELLYAKAGSGNGRNQFTLQDYNQGKEGTSTTGAFAADIPTTIHYGASDVGIGSSDLTNYYATLASTSTLSTPFNGAYAKGAGALIQVPAFALPMTIAYTSAYSKALTLNDAALCGIFSGKITTWAAAQSAVTGTTATTSGYGTGINVVVRSDGSGSTYLLTNHLAKVCTTSNSNFTTAQLAAMPTEHFFALWAGYVKGSNGAADTVSSAPAVTGGLPANFVGQAGSGAVADQLIATTGYIGYISPDYTSIAPSALPHYTKAAALAGKSVYDTSVSPANSPYFKQIKTAKLVNHTSGKAYAPNPGAVNTAFNSITSTDTVNTTYYQFQSTTSTAGLHDDLTLTNADGTTQLGYAGKNTTGTTDVANPKLWVPNVPDPTDGYPIIGTTNLIFATCYKNTNVASYLTSFLTQLYATANTATLKLEGFAAIPATLRTYIKGTFLPYSNTNKNSFFADSKGNNPLVLNNSYACGNATYAATGIGSATGNQ